MPKVTIEFNLPEESYEHREAINASSAFLLISEIDNELRSILKHGQNYYQGISFENTDDLCELIRSHLSEVEGILHDQ